MIVVSPPNETRLARKSGGTVVEGRRPVVMALTPFFETSASRRRDCIKNESEAKLHAETLPILAALTSNALAKVAMAIGAGSTGFAARIVPGLVLSMVAACAVAIAAGYVAFGI
jgi:hypothetical protein